MADDASSVGDASSVVSDSKETSAAATSAVLLQKNASVLDGINGVLFALTQNFKPPTPRYAVFAIVVDWLQLVTFVLNDKFAWAGWALTVLREYVVQLQLANPLRDFGYDAWAAMFWILSVLLLGCVGLCVYVAADFQRDTFSAVWPVKVVRSVLSLFFSLFFTSSLNVFLSAISCDYTVATPTLQGFKTADGLDISCWGGGHAVYAVVGILMAIVFIAISAVLTMVDFDRDFRSRNPLAMPSSRPEFWIFVCKLMFTVCSVLLGQFHVALSVSYFVLSALMTYQTARFLPFLRGWVNVLKGTLYALLCFEAASAIAVSVINDGTFEAPSIAAFTAFPLIIGLAVLLMRARLAASDGRWLVIDASAEAMHEQAELAGGHAEVVGESEGSHYTAPSAAGLTDVTHAQESEHIVAAAADDALFDESGSRTGLIASEEDAGHLPVEVAHGGQFCVKALGSVPASHVLQVRCVFSTPLDVEIATRFAVEPGHRTPENVRAADRIYRHGLALFPGSAFLHLAYASFLTAVGAPGWAATSKVHMERARRCNTSFGDSFAIFVRDTKRKHLAQSEAVGADQDMDLVSYVEFSHQLSLVQKTHRATLKAVRRFWKAILAIQAAGGEITTRGGNRGMEGEDKPPAGKAETRVSVGPGGQGEGRRWTSKDRKAAASADAPIRHASTKAQKRAQAFLETLAASGNEGSSGGGGKQPVVAVDADMLAKLFLRIDNLEAKAKAIYDVLLDKYPKSPKLLRAHGRFLRDVLREVRESDRCFSEASRIDDMQKDTSQTNGSAGARAGAGTINDNADALIVINERGTITTANKPAASLFHTSVSQLVGRPVSILMEASRAAAHPAYIRDYLNTGVGRVVGTRRRVWAKRTDGTLFPIDLAVSQIDDGTGGIAFAGIINEVQENPRLARLTVDNSGSVTAASGSIENMFGLKVSDVIRRNLSVLLPTPLPIRNSKDLEKRFPLGRTLRVSALHQNMATFPVQVTLAKMDARPTSQKMAAASRVNRGPASGPPRDSAASGTGSGGGITHATSMGKGAATARRRRNRRRSIGQGASAPPDDGYEVVIKELVGEYGLVSISERGEIVAASEGALKLFGYETEQELLGRNVKMLMPLPYRAFHDSYLRRFMSTGTATVLGKAPRKVPAVRADGRMIGILLDIKEAPPAEMDKAQGTGVLRSSSAGKGGKPTLSAAAAAAQREEEEEALGLDVGRPRYKRLFTAKIIVLKNADEFEREAKSSSDSGIDRAASQKSGNGGDDDSNGAGSGLPTTRGTARGSLGGGGCPVMMPESGTRRTNTDDETSLPSRSPALGPQADPSKDVVGIANGSETPLIGGMEPQTPLVGTSKGGAFPTPRDCKGRLLQSMTGRKPDSVEEWEEKARRHLEELDSDPLRGVVLADRTSRIVFANARIGAMFGVTAHKLAGHSVALFCPPEIAARHDELVHRYRSTRMPHVIGTPGRHIVARRAGGALFPVSLLMDEADPAVKAAFVYRSRVERAQRRITRLARESVEHDGPDPEVDAKASARRGIPSVASAANLASAGVSAGSALEAKERAEAGISLREVVLEALKEAGAPAGPFGEALVEGTLAWKHHMKLKAAKASAAAAAAAAGCPFHAAVAGSELTAGSSGSADSDDGVESRAPSASNALRAAIGPRITEADESESDDGSGSTRESSRQGSGPGSQASAPESRGPASKQSSKQGSPAESDAESDDGEAAESDDGEDAKDGPASRRSSKSGSAVSGPASKEGSATSSRKSSKAGSEAGSETSSRRSSKAGSEAADSRPGPPAPASAASTPKTSDSAADARIGGGKAASDDGSAVRHQESGSSSATGATSVASQPAIASVLKPAKPLPEEEEEEGAGDEPLTAEEAAAKAAADDDAAMRAAGGGGESNTYVHQYDKDKPIIGFVAYLYSLDELEATVIVDDELIVRHTNAAMWHVSGLYTSELRGASLTTIFPDEDFGEVTEAVTKRKHYESTAGERQIIGMQTGGADDAVVAHLMHEIKTAAAAGVNPLDTLVQEGDMGDSDEESVGDAAAIGRRHEDTSQTRIKLPVPDLVGGRKTVALRHRIGDDVSVLVEFAEVHVPKGSDPAITPPLESSYEVTAHRSRQKEARRSSSSEKDLTFVDYDVYYTGRIVLATITRQDIEYRARSVAKSVLRKKKKKAKKLKAKRRERRARQMGTKTGREIDDRDLPGYESRRNAQLAQALGIGALGRTTKTPAADAAAAAAAEAAAEAAEGSSEQNSEALGESISRSDSSAAASSAFYAAGTSASLAAAVAAHAAEPTFAAYETAQAPNLRAQRQAMKEQGQLHVRFSQEVIDHDNARAKVATMKYYPKEGKTIARTRSLQRLASRGSVGSSAAKEAAETERKEDVPPASPQLPGVDDMADEMILDTDHQSQASSERLSQSGDGNGDEDDLGESASARASSDGGGSDGGGSDGGGSETDNEADADDTGVQSVASDNSSVASGGSSRTGTTIASALDRYLMGEAESQATSRAESEFSGDGSDMGGDVGGQWRMGTTVSDDDGDGEDGPQNGHERVYDDKAGKHRLEEDEVDNEGLLDAKRREAELSQVRTRHLRRLKRNQKLHSSATTLRTLAVWMLVGFTMLFAIPFSIIFGMDSGHESLVRAQFVAGRLSEAVIRESIAVGWLEWAEASKMRDRFAPVEPWATDFGWVTMGRGVPVRSDLLKAEAGVTAQEVATLHRALVLGAFDAVIASGGDAMATTVHGLDEQAIAAVVPLGSRLELVASGISGLSPGINRVVDVLGQSSQIVRLYFDGAASARRFEEEAISLFGLGELYWRSAALLTGPVNATVALPDAPGLSSAVLKPYPNSSKAQSYIEGIGVGVDGLPYGVDPLPADNSAVGPGVVSARPSETINGTAEFWAVVDNGPGSLVAGLFAASTARQEVVDQSLERMVWVLAISFALEAAVPMLALFLLLRPAFARIGRDRVDTFRVFLRVNHSVVLRLSKMPIRVENRDSASDSSSDEGAGHHHHHHHSQAMATLGAPKPSSANVSFGHDGDDGRDSSAPSAPRKHVGFASSGDPDSGPTSRAESTKGPPTAPPRAAVTIQAVPGAGPSGIQVGPVLSSKVAAPAPKRASVRRSSSPQSQDFKRLALAAGGSSPTPKRQPPGPPLKQLSSGGSKDGAASPMTPAKGMSAGDDAKLIGGPASPVEAGSDTGHSKDSPGTLSRDHSERRDQAGPLLPVGKLPRQDRGHITSSLRSMGEPKLGGAVGYASDSGIPAGKPLRPRPERRHSSVMGNLAVTLARLAANDQAGVGSVYNGSVAGGVEVTGKSRGGQEQDTRCCDAAACSWMPAWMSACCGGKSSRSIRPRGSSLPRSIRVAGLALLAIVLAAFAISILVLLGTQQDSEALHLAGIRSSQAAEVQLWALRLVTGAARGVSATETNLARVQLKTHADRLLEVHNTILFRNPAGPAGGSNALDSVPSTGAQSNRLFEPSCLRSEARSGACLHSDHPFKASTVAGMHGLLLRVVAEARALSEQTLQQLQKGPDDNSAFLFVWTATQADLRDGLEDSAKDYQDAILLLLSVRRLADSLALLCLLGAVISINVVLVQPFILRISAETQRAAKMVSLLPPEVDIRKLLPKHRHHGRSSGPARTRV